MRTRRQNRDVASLKGMIKPSRDRHVALDQMKAEISDAYAGRRERKALKPAKQAES